MLKHSGRGHNPKGVDATVEGECAMLCPACPHLSKNLLDNWENAPWVKYWMYTFSSHGWTYFVKEAGYKEFLAEKIGVVQEKSTCLSHNAVNMTDTKTKWGLAATGLGTIDYRKLKEAVPKCVDHQAALKDLEEGFKVEYGDVLEQWRLQVEAWENDQSQLNPFERNADVITLASVWLALAKEEEQSMQSSAPSHFMRIAPLVY
ncbi:hypothetical protein CY34DRAFT_15707 [Suillus luteus UH-Slu-Lm8-n1]|uniref:Uncharacterized protein n=1 Tax=Suillus luteus UH-Slu-Lm8-n1 TaxID=930992 RepID=A0A0C9ZJ28_9AGAM|nr:hypothetical protein CY34DRAFT_15707 [Suillus luteus UH-Slu-Lm8-n1]